jgi:hypothetical protein
MASILKVDTLQKPDGSTPTAADLGIDVAGSVVQAIHDKSFSGATSTAVETWVQVPDLEITIAPKLNGSKFLITTAYHTYCYPEDQMGVALHYAVNGSTNFNKVVDIGTYNETKRTTNASGLVSMTMDAQEYEHNLGLTTSDFVTYRLYFKSRYGVGARVNDNGAGSTLTVLEIAQ